MVEGKKSEVKRAQTALMPQQPPRAQPRLREFFKISTLVSFPKKNSTELTFEIFYLVLTWEGAAAVSVGAMRFGC
jgi:hypothetical protein